MGRKDFVIQGGNRQNIAFRHPSGLFDGGRESLWNVSVNCQVVAARTTFNNMYYRNAQNDMLAQTETDLDKTGLTGELYRYGENCREQGQESQTLPGWMNMVAIRHVFSSI